MGLKYRRLPDGSRILLNTPEIKRYPTVESRGRYNCPIVRKAVGRSLAERAHDARNAERHRRAVERREAKRLAERRSTPLSEKEKFRLVLIARATRAERALCKILVGQVHPVRFDFQKIVLGYIPDFCFPDRNLLIELDGGIHDTPENIRKDRRRDKNLTSGGWTVVRFRNETVFDSPEAILTTIDGAAQTTLN